MEYNDKIKHKYNNIDLIESNDNCEDSMEDLIMKERREQLISKRKKFIQTYRNKQRLSSLIEEKNNNDDNKINNINLNSITMEDIEKEPDPISRIILLKSFFQNNSSNFDIEFINNHLNLFKTLLSDFKKTLFDYSNPNINNRIIINKYILYNFIYILFEPESNPLITEFDFEFLSNLNTFSNFYFNIETIFNKKENIIMLHLNIILLLNNIIRIYPDVELIKATIDIKKIVFGIYNKYFYFLSNINNNNLANNINDNNDNNYINLNECNNAELFVLAYLKLIENCIISLYLNDNDKKELIEIITKFIYYNFSFNEIKLLIYSLESLANTNHTYLLLDNDIYNNFLLYAIEQIIANNNNNIKNEEFHLTKIKLFFELYLQQVLFCINYKNIIKSNIDLNSFLKENIITFFKNYYIQFYYYLNSENKKNINTQKLKIIIKITKIFIFYFDLINETNISLISIEQFNNFKNILCTYFISKNNNGISLFDALINTFLYFIKLENKISQKICNLIINIFNSIYPSKDIDYKNNYSYIKNFQLFLLEKYSLHIQIFPFLNLEKFPNLVLGMISLVNNILFFCEQLDNYEKENCYLGKIKKHLYDLNVFDEIENIESNFVNEDVNFFSHFIIEQYLNKEI
jgi:hypothetical protein